MKVLVTGRAGYIGRTVVSVLIEAGHTPVILDSLVIGRPEFVEGQLFYHGDIADGVVLGRIFHEHPELDAVMHFAVRIEVEEFTQLPSLYYTENLAKAQVLLQAALTAGVRRFSFSSTAAIYQAGLLGEGLREDSPLAPLSAYISSKLLFERVIGSRHAGDSTGAFTDTMRARGHLGRLARPSLRRCSNVEKDLAGTVPAVEWSNMNYA